MPLLKLTSDQIVECVRRRRAGETNTDIGASFGVDASTVSRACKNSGQSPRRSSSVRGIDIPIQSALVELARQVPALPRPRKHTRRKGKFAVAWGLWDCHIGSYAWKAETNNDWDVRIACNRVLNSIDCIVDELEPYKIDRIWMPVGGDLMHFDSVRMTTAFGDHALDIDTRYAKVYESVFDCLCYMVDRAMEICDQLDLFYMPGNHDVSASYTLCVALAQRYRNDRRVKFDLGPNIRKHRIYGGSLVGFTHGHNVKIENLVTALATEAKEVWSKTTYREIQIGHKHQRWEKQYEGVVATNGVLIRRNPSLCNVDAWTHNQAFLGEPMKSVEAWRYSEIGYVGSHVAWADDTQR